MLPSHTAERWKERAIRTRLVAESMRQDPAQAVLLEIAAQYDEAATRYAALKAPRQTGPDEWFPSSETKIEIHRHPSNRHGRACRGHLA